MYRFIEVICMYSVKCSPCNYLNMMRERLLFNTVFTKHVPGCDTSQALDVFNINGVADYDVAKTEVGK